MPELKVSFSSRAIAEKSKQNFKIMLSCWSIFKFRLIFRRWNDKKNRLLNLALLYNSYIFDIIVEKRMFCKSKSKPLFTIVVRILSKS